MNNHMWEHPATQANVATLRGRGAVVLEPGSGRLASKGEEGAGRLPEPAALLEAIEALTRPVAAAPSPDLVGLRVLVTAGGTREPIDAVRFVGNRSSGRMGFALAGEAAALGAAVTVIAANVALPRDARVTYVDVETAAELQAACAAALRRRRRAAHGGRRRRLPPGAQLRRQAQEGRPRSACASSSSARRTSSAASPRRAAPGQTIVGFAAEHGDGALDYGREKLARKGLDAVVVNDVSRSDIGFDAADNEVTILTAARRDAHRPRVQAADRAGGARRGRGAAARRSERRTGG